MRMSGRRFARVGNTETTGVQLHPERLDPRRIPKGPRIFVCSMSDLFHEEVPDPFIVEVFDAMEHHPERTFQVLTKRPERARDWAHEWWCDKLPANVWLGVSIENARYTWRADVLREIPAAVRFISAEPLLGSLFDGRNLPHGTTSIGAGTWWRSDQRDLPDLCKPLDLTGIDWVIIGGESGPRARPFHLEHAREIIGHAAVESYERTGYADDSAVAVFVKQLGAKPIGVSIDVLEQTGQPHFELKLRHPKGGDPDEWPADLRIREFPRTAVPA
jgi:protein gp37